MITAKLTSRIMPGVVHTYRTVVEVSAHVDEDGVLVHALHLNNDIVLQYPADEWMLTIQGLKTKEVS